MKTVDEFPSNAATTTTWGRVPRDRELRRFLHQQKDRGDAIGDFARQALADPGFPPDATVILRYLATRTATTGILAAARSTIKEYRAWHAEGLEAELRQIADVNPERSKEVRESLHEARKITDRLFREDLDA